MSDDEPHRIEDNEPAGQQAETSVRVRRTKQSKVIVRIGFDDNLKEFQMWDYLYDVETEKFELEATSDYKNRIQYYEVTADNKAIRKFKLWMIKNDIKFKFKLDK